MAFNLGNLKVGLLLDAGQVFSGLRQVNKELLGLQRTQERFSQLAPPAFFTRESLAIHREMLTVLEAERAAQATLVVVAKEQAAEDKRRLEQLKATIREEEVQRRRRIDDARQELRSGVSSVSGRNLTRSELDDRIRIIALEEQALKTSRVRADVQIAGAERALAASREDVRVNQVLLGVKNDEAAAAQRTAAAGERALEAARKQQVISENIRDAILALGLGAALTTLNRFSAEAAILAARVENLGTVLRNLGTISGNSLGQLNLYEEQVKRLGITTQATRQVLSLLAANQQDLAQSTSIARIAQDAAAIAGINSSEAAERLVIAVERLDTRLLRSLGIVVNLRQVYAKFANETGRAAETLSAAEKQQLLYNAVVERGAAIQGTYEASLKDAFKQFTSLDRITQEARKEYGERFVPVFELYVKGLAEGVTKLRELNVEYGAGAAAFQAYATAGGAALLATIGLSRGLAILGAAGGKAATAVGGLRVAVGGLLFHPVTIAVGALAAAFVFFSAKAREASLAQKALSESLRAGAQRGVELQSALKTVQEFGNVTHKTAEQQQEFDRSLRVVSGFLPEYSARLRAAEKDMVQYNKILREAGVSIGVINKRSEELARDHADRLGKDLLEAVRGAGRRSIDPAVKRFSEEQLRDTIGFTQEDLDALTGKIKDTKKEAVALAKLSAAEGQSTESIINNLGNAIGIRTGEVEVLIDAFRRATTQANGLGDAFNSVETQKFQRELERQAAALEVFEDQAKRQVTESRRLLDGTAAEEIDQLLRIGKALSIRFKTEAELRQGAEATKKLALASAESELRSQINVAKAAVVAAKADDDRIKAQAKLASLEDAFSARRTAAEKAAADTVADGLLSIEKRNIALKTAFDRTKRVLAAAQQELQIRIDMNKLDERGLRARAAGRPVEEIQAQVQQTAKLYEIELARVAAEEKIRVATEEVNVQLRDAERAIAAFNSQPADLRLKNAGQQVELENAVLSAKQAQLTAQQQINEEIRKQRNEVKGLAQDQLDDLKTLVKGFNDARAAREAFDSPQAVASRQKANQQALTQERIRQEQAGASQIEVEAALVDLRNQQAQEEAAKREELDKTLQTEQQRSKGAFKEQRAIERELKRQGLDPRKAQRDSFKDQRDLRAEETNQILALLKPKDRPFKPGEAEAALANFRRNVPEETIEQILAGRGKQNGNFVGLQQGQANAEKQLAEFAPQAAAIGEANAAKQELIDSLVVINDGMKQQAALDGKIYGTVREAMEIVQLRVAAIDDSLKGTLEYLQNQGRKAAVATNKVSK